MRVYVHRRYSKVCRDSVRAVVDGFNSAICAYGQTSSGKTYTIMGSGFNVQKYATHAPAHRHTRAERARAHTIDGAGTRRMAYARRGQRLRACLRWLRPTSSSLCTTRRSATAADRSRCADRVHGADLAPHARAEAEFWGLFAQLSMSYLEIYQEKVTDLLSGKDMRASKASPAMAHACVRGSDHWALISHRSSLRRKTRFSRQVGLGARWRSDHAGSMSATILVASPPAD
jgi:hypothetical protein